MSRQIVAAEYVVRSRLKPPESRVQLIRREGLLERLDAGLSRRVTLLRAGAGFGKTTLLTQWRERLLARGVHCAWLTLERADGNTSQFFAQICEALAPLLGEVGMLELRPGYQETRASLLPKMLLHRLESAPGPIVLMLDNYQSATGTELFAACAEWLSCLPEHVHVVLSTRSRTVPELADLQVQGQVVDVTAQDLRLSRADTDALFAPISEPAVLDQLHTHTEGWPVAVQLAAMALRDAPDEAAFLRAFPATTELMSSYLVGQVLAAVDETARDALIATSILEQINADLISTLTGIAASDAIVRAWEPLGALLSSVDGSRYWYKCHPLVREYLKSRLRERGDRHVRELHLRAAHWFLENQLLEEAIQHAVLAREPALAARYLEQEGAIWIGVRHGKTHLQRLIDAVPISVVDRSLRLRIARAFVWMRDGNGAEAFAELSSLATEMPKVRDVQIRRDWTLVQASSAVHVSDSHLGLAELKDLQRLARTTSDSVIRGVMDNLLGLMYSRNAAWRSANHAFKRALTYYDSIGAANPRVWTRALLGELLLSCGDVEEARSWLQTAQSLAKERMSADTALIAMTEMLLATAHYQAGNIEQARELCLPALSQMEQGEGFTDFLIHGYRTAAALLMTEHRTEHALALLDRGRIHAERWGLPRLDRMLAALRIETQARTGDVADDAFDELLQRCRQTAPAMIRERDVVLMALGHMALVNARERDILLLFEQRLSCAEGADMTPNLVQVRLLMARLYDAMDNHSAATEQVVAVLDLAAAKHLYGAVLASGPAAITLIQRVINERGMAKLPGRALAFCGKLLALHRGKDERSALRASLSSRELEILGGLAGGLSNKQIARPLGLSEETIKYHLRKLYARLGVNDRQTAVEIARQLSMLE